MSTQTVSDEAYAKWGKLCSVCGTILGIQIHHIDENHANNSIENLMPLCASCHQEITSRNYSVDPTDRSVSVTASPYYRLAPHTEHPPATVAAQVANFYREFKGVPEREDNAKLVLAQDQASVVYYIDCHLPAKDVDEKIDTGTRLRVLSGDGEQELDDVPEEEQDEAYAEFGFNREIQTKHPVFQRMVSDASRGRAFLGIVLEWDQFYRPEQPLKVLGGQHRCEAVRRAVLADQQLDRLHSARVYFGLNAEQQAEIIDIYNANIDVPKALWDRIGEQLLGNASRLWCQRVGLLEADEDFAGRASVETPMTVQILRCLVVNYFKARDFDREFEGEDAVFLEGADVIPTGAMEPNEAYEQLAKNAQTWSDTKFEEAGRNFAKLHKAQRQACQTTTGLRRFQNKALTPAVAAGWAFVAGLLAQHPDRLTLLYRLGEDYDHRIAPDPLNASYTHTYSHPKDDTNYRGLGTRQSKSEAQKLAYLFLAHSSPAMTRNGLQQQLCTYAVGEYYRLFGRLKQQQEETKQQQLRERLERH